MYLIPERGLSESIVLIQDAYFFKCTHPRMYDCIRQVLSKRVWKHFNKSFYTFNFVDIFVFTLKWVLNGLKVFQMYIIITIVILFVIFMKFSGRLKIDRVIEVLTLFVFNKHSSWYSLCLMDYPGNYRSGPL